MKEESIKEEFVSENSEDDESSTARRFYRLNSLSCEEAVAMA